MDLAKNRKQIRYSLDGGWTITYILYFELQVQILGAVLISTTISRILRSISNNIKTPLFNMVLPGVGCVHILGGKQVSNNFLSILWSRSSKVFRSLFGHTCLKELVGPMNCSRYMVGAMVKSTLKLTRIH